MFLPKKTRDRLLTRELFLFIHIKLRQGIDDRLQQEGLGSIGATCSNNKERKCATCSIYWLRLQV